jgi:hypothetical protein
LIFDVIKLCPAYRIAIYLLFLSYCSIHRSVLVLLFDGQEFIFVIDLLNCSSYTLLEKEVSVC